ncbi:PIN domain-containing protein [Microbaculum marinum]|uniref:PIN domain-containing protein n=1 Tax=Microbaculum marinum TaxID=1764581 RepID=A0AAW9RTE9_9HYPH
MIGLDTNVLVRYIVADDADQAKRAARFIEDNLSPEVPGYIGIVVLVELVWVLERAYGYSRGQITGLLDALLTTAELRVEDAESIWPLLDPYRKGSVGFSDLVIASRNVAAGCAETVTFDRRFDKLSGVTSL